MGFSDGDLYRIGQRDNDGRFNYVLEPARLAKTASAPARDFKSGLRFTRPFALTD